MNKQIITEFWLVDTRNVLFLISIYFQLITSLRLDAQNMHAIKTREKPEVALAFKKYMGEWWAAMTAILQSFCEILKRRPHRFLDKACLVQPVGSASWRCTQWYRLATSWHDFLEAKTIMIDMIRVFLAGGTAVLERFFLIHFLSTSSI